MATLCERDAGKRGDRDLRALFALHGAKFTQTCKAEKNSKKLAGYPAGWLTTTQSSVRIWAELVL